MSRTILCAECGAPLQTEHPRRKYHIDCAKEHNKKYYRDYQRKKYQNEKLLREASIIK